MTPPLARVCACALSCSVLAYANEASGAGADVFWAVAGAVDPATWGPGHASVPK